MTLNRQNTASGNNSSRKFLKDRYFIIKLILMLKEKRDQ
jgi:hypothetical protein